MANRCFEGLNVNKVLRKECLKQGVVQSTLAFTVMDMPLGGVFMLLNLNNNC